MKTLTYDDIIGLHSDILADTQGLAGIRDENLLRSSITGPFQTMFGRDLYPSDIDKMCRMGYNIIMNHPFNDGNKRTGLHVMFTLLKMNGYTLNKNAKDAHNFIIELASGNKTYEELVTWINTLI